MHGRQLDPSYRPLLEAAGSITDGQAAGTYALAAGDPVAATGAGILYPLKLIHLAAADFPSRNDLTVGLRIGAILAANDTAPGGDFTVALHPVTRPASSGGAAALIYTIGAAIAGSAVTFTAPAADDLLAQATADFALPADGFYCLGLVTTAAIAASAHVHINAQLQARYAA